MQNCNLSDRTEEQRAVSEWHLKLDEEDLRH